MFKSLDNLATLPQAGAGAPKFASGICPIDKASTRALAIAMAKQVKGEVGVIFAKSADFRAFALSNASEEDIKSLLADDPRIEYIEAELPIKLDMTMQTSDSTFYCPSEVRCWASLTYFNT